MTFEKEEETVSYNPGDAGVMPVPGEDDGTGEETTDPDAGDETVEPGTGEEGTPGEGGEENPDEGETKIPDGEGNAEEEGDFSISVTVKPVEAGEQEFTVDPSQVLAKPEAPEDYVEGEDGTFSNEDPIDITDDEGNVIATETYGTWKVE